MIGHDEHDNEKADDDEDDADFHDAEKDNNYHLHSHSLSPPSGHIPAATLLLPHSLHPLFQSCSFPHLLCLRGSTC